MGEIVNFNKARKAQKKAQADKTATANRVKFGQTKAEKRRAAALKDQAAKALDGARREPEKP